MIKDIPPNTTTYVLVCASDNAGNVSCVNSKEVTKTFTATNIAGDIIINSNSWYNDFYQRVNANVISMNFSNNQAFLGNDLGLAVSKGYILYGNVTTLRSSETVEPRLYMYTSNSLCSWPTAIDGCYVNDSNSNPGTWVKIGCSLTNNATYLNNIMLAQANASAVWYAYYTGFKVYDLTTIFGSGNEPSTDWCDKYIN